MIKVKDARFAKTQEQIAGVESILSFATAVLSVAAEFSDKDLSPLQRKLLTGVNVVSGVSTGVSVAEWVHAHNEVLHLENIK